MMKASTSKANELATTDLEVLDILCGESLHTINSELYNCGACYNPEALNEDGICDRLSENRPSSHFGQISCYCCIW